MRVHVLKSWPLAYRAARLRMKTFEIRRDDRPFQEGDRVVLCEWDPERGRFLGGYLEFVVGYVERSKCLPRGWCGFALLEVPEGAETPVYVWLQLRENE